MLDSSVLETNLLDAAVIDAAVTDSASPLVDAGAPDSAVVVQPGDQLLLSPARARVGAGLLECIQVIVQHPDGSRDSVATSSSLSVSIGDSSIATLAGASECEDAIGVIGLRPGLTTARVTLEGGDESASFSLPLEVFPVRLRASAPLLANLAVGRGDTISLPFDYLRFTVLDSSGAPPAERRGRPRPAWIRLASADPSIATVVVVDSFIVITGIADGSTSLRVAYDGPVTSFESENIALRVVSGGTFRGLVSIRLQDERGIRVDPEQPFAVGQCARATLVGEYSLPSGSSYQTRMEGAVFTTTGALTRTGDRVCGSEPGDGLVSGCVGGNCRSLGLAVLGSLGVSRLELEVESTSPIEVSVSDPFGLCAPVRAFAIGSDGSRVDVTRSPALLLSATVPTMIPGDPRIETWARDTDAAGAGIFSAAGAPCFRLRGGNRPIGATVTATVDARYVRRAASATVQVRFPGL